MYNDDEIVKRFRFPRVAILQLTEDVTRLLPPFDPRGGAVPVHLQVCIALRFYACGSFQQVLGDIVGVTQPTGKYFFFQNLSI